MASRPELLTDALFDRLEALAAFASERGHTLAANAAAAAWELGSDDLATPGRL